MPNPNEYPAPSAPYAVAQKLYREHLSNAGMSHLAAWRGGWMAWQQTRWVEIDAAALRQSIYAALSQATYQHPIREHGFIVDYETREWCPDKHKLANVLEALAAVVHLPSDIDPPAWINDVHSAKPNRIIPATPEIDTTKTPAAQIISCGNGLLDLSTRQLHDHTPALFNLVSVPLDYRFDAIEPAEWLKFLASIWSDDDESIMLLQEFFGYVLSGRMDMQKMLMLHGPIRSGKGTIERVLAALMGGHRNIASPTLASLSTNFGLSPLIGKPLAFITDARLGNIPSHTVVERLLSITGEDWLTIDRKYREPWTGKLPTRFVILTNELPKFRDSSGAIATRLLILTMTNSFLGREDHLLYDKLLPELDGILVWALQGLDRLTRNGCFTEPKSSRDSAALMMDMASPVSAFIREKCIRGPGEIVTRDALFAAYRVWCEENGHTAGAKSTFGRDLRAVVPEIKDVRSGRIDGRQIRCYTHIGFAPDSPVSPDRTGRESDTHDSSDTTKPQVNDVESGESGSTLNVGLTFCRYCGEAIPDDQPRAQANGYCNAGRCIAMACNERSKT